MPRRLGNVALLALAAWLALAAAGMRSSDPLRAALVAAVAGLGVCMNLIGAVGRRIDFRPWLRGLSVAVLLIAALAVLARSIHLREFAIPELPEHDTEFRAAFESAAQNLRWIALALGYCGVSLLLLPPHAGRRTPAEQSPAAPQDSSPEAGGTSSSRS